MKIPNELVDNVVDACSHNCDATLEETTIKRVRINIKKVEKHSFNKADNANNDREPFTSGGER